MTSDRFSRLTWDERLLLEDALATYAGTYSDSHNYQRVACSLEDELRETLNADREADGLD